MRVKLKHTSIEWDDNYESMTATVFLQGVNSMGLPFSDRVEVLDAGKYSDVGVVVRAVEKANKTAPTTYLWYFPWTWFRCRRMQRRMREFK